MEEGRARGFVSRQTAIGLVAGAAAIGVVSAVIAGLKPHIDPVGLTGLYLFAILPVAIVWGFWVAGVVAIASYLTFSFFFAPPLRHFAIRVRPVDAGYRSGIRRTSRPAADDTRAADKQHSSGARHHREHIPASNEEIHLSSAANGIQRGDQRSVSERARVTLRADIPAGTGRLPDRIRACLFDMDGVLTETATLHAVGGAGLGTAAGSSSANCREVLEAAGIADLFDVRVDGGTVERDHLHGKPAPDSFLAAARELGMEPAAAAVFEDALAGVAAGRAGCFACVVGVDRAGQAVALRRLGADVVVADLAELLASS